MSGLGFVSTTVLLLVVLGGILTGPALADEAAAPARSGGNGLTDLSSPEFKSFPLELLRNFGRLPRSENLLPIAIGSAATGATSLMDEEVQDYFSQHESRPFADVGYVLGSPAVMAAASGAVFVAAYSGGDQRFRRFGFSLMQGFVVNLALTESVKFAVARRRPDGADSNSFPSGHTSGLFTVARIVHHHYGPVAATAAYATASFVAISRLESNRHWLSDVVAGATLGIIVGGTVSRGTEAASSPSRVSWSPMLGPDGVGVMIRLTL